MKQNIYKLEEICPLTLTVWNSLRTDERESGPKRHKDTQLEKHVDMLIKLFVNKSEVRKKEPYQENNNPVEDASVSSEAAVGTQQRVLDVVAAA